MLKKATNLYKYKTKGFQEIFDVLHHYFSMGLLTQKKQRLKNQLAQPLFFCVIDYNLVQIFFQQMNKDEHYQHVSS